MTFELIIDPEAKSDLAQARRWYDDQDPGVGRRFAQAVDAAFQRIKERPHLYPLVTEDVHFITPRRFPYVVYYRVEGSNVVVLAIVHQRRDSAVWRRRL
ncbi:MAG TPA: type II toxin-antitoxin system RelE/ParE family toxin [Gemmataceae bacterium]|nr:type II toxin-antitoxin system RelE/ParE family toxin [Gemmataceae bacterium]